MYCPQCNTDFQAVLTLYRKLIREFPRLSELPIDQAFGMLLQREMNVRDQSRHARK